MKNDHSSLTKKIGISIGLIAVIIVSARFLHGTFFSHFFQRQIDPGLVALFEYHWWQFAAGFTAVVLLSRGHLWSYGINSKNLKVSMEFLGWLYLCTIVITGSVVLVDKNLISGSLSAYPSSRPNMIMEMIVLWMSSPIANTVLFFGFGQTVLLKYIDSTTTALSIPLSVFFSALLYTVFSTSPALIGGGIIPAALSGLIGMYSGIVYWKTGSLITPMLGQAFYFGFPFLIKIVMSY